MYIRIYTRFTPSHYLRSRVARASILLVSCDVWVRASAVLGSQATVHASVTTVHTYGPRSLHTLSGQLYHTCTNEHMRVCCVRPCTSRVPDLRWRDERGPAVANCSKPYERASEEAATRTPARPPELAKPSMPLLVRHRCAATGARVLCRPRRDARRACEPRDGRCQHGVQQVRLAASDDFARCCDAYA